MNARAAIEPAPAAPAVDMENEAAQFLAIKEALIRSKVDYHSRMEAEYRLEC